MKFGERDLEGALAWDKVKQANYKTTNSYSNFADVVYKSNQRVLNDKKFQKINEYAKWLKKNQDQNTYSLNYNEFKKESNEKSLQGKQFKEVFKFKSNITFNAPKYEYDLFKKDSVLKGKRLAWHKNLKKDIYMNEALNVLSELKMKKEYSIVKH
ncbi:carboxy terminal-processing peptidase [Tenacibaculum sp. nBUS_03]|uniref:carboxy terminal-processing peptidase n=1 Tax=Tenacibaculum sp. nBUS_03 TaxID=3395320 RepID=UPI003EBAD027